MHRLLRLLTLWLIALALPIQGAAATAMAPMSPSQAMAPDRAAMTEAAPCPQHAMHQASHHAIDPRAPLAAEKSGCCGDCCGPIAWLASALAVAPTGEAWLPAARGRASAVTPQFLTDGPERPPRPFLA